MTAEAERNTMRRIRKHVIILAVLLAFLFPGLASEAIAQRSIDFASFGAGFSCDGPVSSGRLFDNGTSHCDPDGTRNLFSTAVCTYEDIIDQVLSRLYCGIQYSLLQPLGALMILFMAVIGAGFSLGIIPFTPRETVFALFKFGLVYYFSTESQLTIGILYVGVMGFIQDSITIIMQYVAPDLASLSGPGGLFDKIDEILEDFVKNAATSQDPATPCQAGLIAMFLTFVVSIPALAFLGVGMAVQFAMVFFQMALGYFISITAIMFLTALAPIFLSFAMFKFTRNYFDKWAAYLMSFAVQIFVVFGFIGLVVSLQLDEDLRELFELSQPYTIVRQAEGVRAPYRDLCTVCEPEEFGEFGIACKSTKRLDPQALLSNPDFVKIFFSRFFKILVLAYLLHKAMIAVPGVARAIGGGSYAPAMAGEDVFKLGESANFPGSPTGGKSHGHGKPAGSTAGGIRDIFSPLVTKR